MFPPSAHAGTRSSPRHDPAQETAGEENKHMINVMPILVYIKSLKYTQAWQGKMRQVYL